MNVELQLSLYSTEWLGILNSNRKNTPCSVTGCVLVGGHFQGYWFHPGTRLHTKNCGAEGSVVTGTTEPHCVKKT